ncbi:MAG: hypothetical protein AAB663_02485 [Patescibacteria group bacterium]
MVQLCPDDVMEDPGLADKLMLLITRIGHGVVGSAAGKLQDAGYARVFQAVDLDRGAYGELGLTTHETNSLFAGYIALDSRFAAFALSPELAEMCHVASTNPHDIDKPTRLRQLCAKAA